MGNQYKTVGNWFWDLVPDFEAIDLVDPEIFDFQKFCSNLSSVYIL